MNSTQTCKIVLECADENNGSLTQIVELDGGQGNGMTPSETELFKCSLTCELYNLYAFDSHSTVSEVPAVTLSNITVCSGEVSNSTSSIGLLI